MSQATLAFIIVICCGLIGGFCYGTYMSRRGRR